MTTPPNNKPDFFNIPVGNIGGYNNNPRLRRENSVVPFTQEMLDERIRCASDPVYFLETYMKIINLDKGFVTIQLYDFQKELLQSYLDNRFVIAKLPRQVGKCVGKDTKVVLRNMTSKDCITLSVEVLYNKIKSGSYNKINTISNKFIESFEITNFDIQTDTGWQPISHIHKTVPYQVWTIKTENGKTLECADDHIIFDEDLNQTYAKDSLHKNIQTDVGVSKVISLECSELLENMFDLTVDSEDHRLYTNGILSHNTTVTVGFLLWMILFKADQNIAILANKAGTARDILQKLTLSYEAIPIWMQQGCRSWNKGSIELENNSKIVAASTSSSAGRSGSYSVVFLDEFAFVPRNIAEDFMTSVYPTISSGSHSKVIMVSTPNGMNLFYKFWQDALEKRNLYVPIQAHWSCVPGRDEKWKAQQIMQMGEEKFNQEFGCEFLNSSGSLLSATTMSEIVWRDPIEKVYDGLDIYEKLDTSSFDPIVVQKELDRQFVIVVDVARATGNDYSAFTVIDVTSVPYRLVAKYRNNKITPTDYANMIVYVARMYNDAFLLVENNDVGSQICDIVYSEFDYTNIFSTKQSEKKNKQQAVLGSTKGTKFGVRTTSSVKQIGCMNLKTLMDSKILTICDHDIFTELTTFVKTGSSYAAEVGCNDDLVMCLVLFGWLTTQETFKTLTNATLRDKLMEEIEISKTAPPLMHKFSDQTVEEEDVQIDKSAFWEIVGGGAISSSQGSNFSYFTKKPSYPRG